MRRLENRQIRFLHFAEERRNTLKRPKIARDTLKQLQSRAHVQRAVVCVLRFAVKVCTRVCVCVLQVKVTVKQNKGSACGGSEGDRWFGASASGSLSWTN